MKNKFNLLLAILCLLMMASPSHAAKPKAPQQAQKERLVLMPLRIPEEDRNLQGAMETALVEGLQQKYVVFSGEQVAQKAREIFLKESRNTAKKECDETRCMQGIAEAFQAELIATANVTKKDGGYFLALSVQNIFDNKVEYSKSLPCKNCDSFQVVDKLKELSGASVPTAPVAAAPSEPEAPKATPADPDGITWAEAQKGNAVDDYQVYLDAYPKGKYIAFAKAKLKKLKEAEQAATEQQEQQTWDAAQAENSEASYGLYLKGYPNGRFAGFAKTRQNKLKTDVAAKEEADLWQKAGSGNDQTAVEAYLNKYPNGRYIGQATAKLKLFKEEAAKFKAPEMVRIPGRNYELGKYEVTQKEWRDIMGSNPSNFEDCGDNCPVELVSWNDIQAFLKKLNQKTGKQYRLPTDDEWKYACQAGQQTKYCGANDINAVAWHEGNSGMQTHPVGQKQANGYGLYDMNGNVNEWKQDPSSILPDKGELLGGSWFKGPFDGTFFDDNPKYSGRFPAFPSDRHSSFGFRLARTLP